MKTSVVLLAACFVMGVGALISTQAAPPRLLPFQGRITDASGTPVADGAKVVQFKIYDAPTGGTAVWNGEVQKITVNGGLVSTLLGSKADLAAVDFNQALYLEITVDANADNQITVADPPLLPRQSVLPAVFAVEAQSARDSVKLQGFDWSAVFDNGNPATGNIPANRVTFPVGSLPATVINANKSIVAGQLALNAVDTTEIKDNAVTTAKIKDGEVKTGDLADGAVTSLKILDGTIVNADLASASITPDRLLPQFAIFAQKEPTSAATAGAIVSNQWTKATLNTDMTTESAKLGDAEFAHPDIELTAANRLKLKASGIYFVHGTIPCRRTDFHQSRIARMSGAVGTSVLLGTNGLAEDNVIAGANAGDTSTTSVRGYIKVSAPPEEFELQLISSNIASGGLGEMNANGFGGTGENWIFSTLHVIKVR